MNLLNKILTSSTISITACIVGFFLSSSAEAYNEEITVSNGSNQTILIQHPPVSFALEPSRTQEQLSTLSFNRGEHWYSTTTSDSITTVTSTNNTPICTVKAHYSNAFMLPIRMTMLETDNYEKCHIKPGSLKVGINPLENKAIMIDIS